jgi:HK97 family phage major capsid protein
MRLERLADERTRTEEKIGDIIELAEEEQRELAEYEAEQLSRHRTHLTELETEIGMLADDLKRVEGARDVSEVIRGRSDQNGGNTGNGSSLGSGTGLVEFGQDGPVVYRTFAAYARDVILSRFDLIASQVDGPGGATQVREQAMERLQRTVQNTTTSDIEGLLPPQHMAQIMDIIDGSRPVVTSARRVDLSSGKLTYPKIAQRPEVLKQGSEKTEAGTQKMEVTLEDMTADTYLGAGDLSWQAINWSTPNALQLWFDLAAEAYGRATETAACVELAGTAIGTISVPLGTAGTENFGQWSAAIVAGIGGIYNTTGGRARTNTLYLSADRFFALAGIATDQVLNLSAVGNLDIASMTGTFRGLRVVGSYGFSSHTAIVGDSSAFLVAETPGAPVEMRAVEPAIGGMEVGVIGAFQSKVFDPQRFTKLS